MYTVLGFTGLIGLVFTFGFILLHWELEAWCTGIGTAIWIVLLGGDLLDKQYKRRQNN
jgi:hypothetical protein